MYMKRIDYKELSRIINNNINYMRYFLRRIYKSYLVCNVSRETLI